MYVFHLRRFDGWGEGSSAKVLQPLKDLLKSSDILKCGVNIKNDVEILNACSPGLELRRQRRCGRSAFDERDPSMPRFLCPRAPN